MKLTDNTLNQARALLRSQEKALLSTHSRSKPGYPFGSVTTFMADDEGHPLFYISDLAQHTRNIKDNPKMSLLVSQENEDDINAGARLTLLGHAEPVSEDEAEDISASFLQRFPESKKYQKTHDFAFYRLRVEHVRYIGGFGQIFWLPLDRFLLSKPTWKDRIQPAIDHMNEDHKEALQLITAHRLNIQHDHITMTHLFSDGMVIQLADKHNHYIPFTQVLQQAGEMRRVLVEMTHEARTALTA